MKRLNMFLADWITVLIWCSLFALDIRITLMIMAFVLLIFAVLNYYDSKKTVRLFMEDINLMGATIIGILLSNLLFIKLVYADRERVSTMVVEIFAAMVYITVIMIISMIIKEVSRKRRRRIINRLINEPDESSEEEGDDDDYDDEEDDYDDDEEEEKYETERRVLERMDQISDNEEDTDDDTDEGLDDEEHKGPKFKVVVKKGKTT